MNFDLADRRLFPSSNQKSKIKIINPQPLPPPFVFHPGDIAVSPASVDDSILLRPRYRGTVPDRDQSSFRFNRPGALRKLIQMNQAGALDDLKVPPGNRLEALKGRLAGFYSVRVNDQWRIVFRWANAGPSEVAIVDYH